ncbi:MAG: hypothetical protein IJI78_05675 [Oscillospiraceae bacterium]|nr:hypothetical protein [Oscillospiraceae bacterium]
MAEEKTTFHRDESLQADKPGTEKPIVKKEKKSKKKKNKDWIAFLVLFIGLACAVAALFFSGFFNRFFEQPEQEYYYTYDVNNSETLMKYLTHGSLKAGDTLNATAPITIDVDKEFNGFAELPLVNWTGSNVTFENGTVILLGGNSKEADMSPISFRNTDAYIDAPNTALTWTNVSDESKVNVATLNGVEHLKDLRLVMPGAVFETPVTLRNVGTGALTGVPVKLSSPNYIFVDGDTLTVDMEAGASTTVNVKVIATQAGRAKITGVAYDNAGNQIVEAESDYLSIAGPGYYAGEPHANTELSGHGKRGTFSELVTQSYKSGFSWLGYYEVEVDPEEYTEGQIDSLTSSHGDFIVIPGVETGTELKAHHLVAFNTDAHPLSEYGKWIDDHGYWVMQDAVDEFVADGGIVVLPHFFGAYDLTESIAMFRSLRDETAMELFYNDLEIDSMSYRVTVNVWNNVNVRGQQKLYALGSSWYIDPETIGNRYTKGYMTSLSEQSFYDMLTSGNYFVTNGPEVYFTLGSGQMGGDISVAEGDKALCKVAVSDDCPIQTITVLRYVITGVMDNEIKDEVWSVDLTGQNVTSYQGTVLLDMKTDEDCFYRVEVVTEKGNRGTDRGLAFSNPIWTYRGDKTGDAMFTEITPAENAEIKISDDGTYYVVGEKLKSSSISVTADESSMVFVDYHKVTGNNFASYYTVRIIAEDGTIHTEKIYAIDTYTGKKK